MRINFEIIAPDGSVHHTGVFHQYAADERRAFAERIASCQANGYEVRTWLAGMRPINHADYRRGFKEGSDKMARIVQQHGIPEQIPSGRGWCWPKRRNWSRIALVIGWLIVGGAAAYAVPTRIHEIITAHQSE